MNLKALALAAALALGGTAAKADVVVSSDRDWEVRLNFSEAGTPYCKATTYAPGILFSVYLSPGRPASIQITLEGTNLGEGKMAFTLQVDTNAAWEFNGADAMYGSIFYDFDTGYYGDNTSQFIQQLANGRSLYFLDSRGRPIWSLSLSGSRSSLKALAACREVIG